MAEGLKENIEPVQKKRRLSLKRKADPVRFAKVDEKLLESSAKGVVPGNTAKNTAWATRNFAAWVETHNSVAADGDKVPDNLLVSTDPDLVCSWLCRFVLETRQQNGDPYPPKSIYSILCGLFRVSRDNKVPFNFLDKSDARFKALHNTLDSLFSQLHADGVGAVKKSACVIAEDDEKLLLEKKVMSYDDPKSLQRLVFYYIGLQLCLRGVQEHHDLRVDQLQRHPSDIGIYNESTFYTYTEFISKNNVHRFKDIHSHNKVVNVHAVPGLETCVVKMLDFYLSKLPQPPKAFYLRPHLQKPKHDAQPWYINVPVGVNTLKTFMPKMSEEAGTSVRYTNHSLRATSTTRMFAANVPEKIIQEKSGHHSLAGLRAYEKTTMAQERSVTKILASVGNIVDEATPSHSKELVTDTHSKELPQATNLFSGELHNCVFNFQF